MMTDFKCGFIYLKLNLDFFRKNGLEVAGIPILKRQYFPFWIS